MKEEIDAIHQFWFGPLGDDGFAGAQQNRLWFSGSEETDATVRSHFGHRVTQALAGELNHWGADDMGLIALLLLLDQFTRNIYRGTGEVFRQDARALAIAVEGVGKDQLSGLSLPQQSFFLMPYQHSEDLDIQKAGVELYQTLASDVAEDWQPVAEGYRDFAIRHHDIIARFGRFPHRNTALGRKSTAEEEQYLAEGGDTFGQQS